MGGVLIAKEKGSEQVSEQDREQIDNLSGSWYERARLTVTLGWLPKVYVVKPQE